MAQVEVDERAVALYRQIYREKATEEERARYKHLTGKDAGRVPTISDARKDRPRVVDNLRKRIKRGGRSEHPGDRELYTRLTKRDPDKLKKETTEQRKRRLRRSREGMRRVRSRSGALAASGPGPEEESNRKRPPPAATAGQPEEGGGSAQLCTAAGGTSNKRRRRPGQARDAEENPVERPPGPPDSQEDTAAKSVSAQGAAVAVVETTELRGVSAPQLRAAGTNERRRPKCPQDARENPECRTKLSSVGDTSSALVALAGPATPATAVGGDDDTPAGCEATAYDYGAGVFWDDEGDDGPPAGPEEQQEEEEEEEGAASQLLPTTGICNYYRPTSKTTAPPSTCRNNKILYVTLLLTIGLCWLSLRLFATSFWTTFVVSPSPPTRRGGGGRRPVTSFVLSGQHRLAVSSLSSAKDRKKTRRLERDGLPEAVLLLDLNGNDGREHEGRRKHRDVLPPVGTMVVDGDRPSQRARRRQQLHPK